jgi:3-demethoxyubiquinol 3-hydroxylase
LVWIVLFEKERKLKVLGHIQMVTDKIKHTNSRPLPGSLSHNEEISQMIRVNHAGEFGAKRIYEGQLAVFGKNHPISSTIQHMYDQEMAHLETFENLVTEKRVRPSALHPFWHVAGFTLGAGTALMGKKAAMACTAAVEEVIDEHYQEQREKLQSWNEEAKLEKTIEKFQAEEVDHKKTAFKHGAEQTLGYFALSSVIKLGCRTAIWLAKKY